jgi:hypothetical protein
MRTTLDLDDDLVAIAKQFAQQRGATMGQVISELAHRGLQPKGAPKIRNGVLLFTPKRSKTRPSLALVNRLRDEE